MNRSRSETDRPQSNAPDHEIGAGDETDRAAGKVFGSLGDRVYLGTGQIDGVFKSRIEEFCSKNADDREKHEHFVSKRQFRQEIYDRKRTDGDDRFLADR